MQKACVLVLAFCAPIAAFNCQQDNELKKDEIVKQAEYTKLEDHLANVEIITGEYRIREFTQFASYFDYTKPEECLLKFKRFQKKCCKKGHDINAIIICQILLDPHRPLIGGPDWRTNDLLTYEVREPLVFYKGMPILAVGIYSLGGVAQSADEFLDQCLLNRRWTNSIFSADDETMSKNMSEFLDLAGLGNSDSQDVRYLSKREFFLDQTK